MDSTQYDFTIIGAGAAGLHLALAMLENPFFRDKSILLLEKDDKNTNDRTWCFGEKSDGKWNEILKKSWKTGNFNSKFGKTDLTLGEYSYKMVQGIDFYNFAKNKIKNNPNFHWKKAEVLTVNEKNIGVEIKSNIGIFQANHVFDSRISPNFYAEKNNYTRLWQHFKGWFIETEEDFFNPEDFTIMDYRLKYKESTSFTYVLPTSKRHALVEFTFFTPFMVGVNEYDAYLAQYIQDFLNIKCKYSIQDTEFGVIPMTNYPFQLDSSDKITKIGTAGGWVKPSSGYSFKNSEKFAQKTVENIQKGLNPAENIANSRHRQYDELFLDVLYKHNEKGERLFFDLYSKNPTWRLFEFLDENSTPINDAKIMFSVEKMPFIKALKRKLIA